MYQRIKGWLRQLLPPRVLFRYEPAFRTLFALLYTGNRFQCNLCGKRLRRFVALANGDQLCPRCGSLARDRRLWALLQSGFLQPGMEVLDFSPSRSLYRRLRVHPGIRYHSTDISGDFLADHHYDITDIDAPAERFGLIICYHVLEHISDDRQAMRELLRILKPEGVAIIQTPFRDGAIYEDPAISSPAGRLQHFGQEDHVRIYSVSGLQDRLETAGFSVAIQRLNAAADNRYGWAREETILVAVKSPVK